MSLRVHLVYKDGNDLNVELSQEEYQDFFKCLNEGKVFWGKKFVQGFWTNVADIRFFQIVPQDGENGEGHNLLEGATESNPGENSERNKNEMELRKNEDR